MSDLALLIGSKNYSSWSLRPWLMLRQSGLPFSEECVALRSPEFAERVRAWSPAGKVPVLRHGKRVIWDSLAIGEYLAETFPERGLWPRDPGLRAEARAVAAEMHSGFLALRSQMPMNIRVRRTARPTPELDADLSRVKAIFAAARGPFLFGEFSIADAMYGPVAFRFQTYGVRDDYAESLLKLPALREWAEAAQHERDRVPEYDAWD
ncbi:MAG TPA: glutathione S-transferase family protein [Myxococcota bacterium]|nr:glutathione S-transferase family protein [Myxococcota bacterium]